MRPIPNYVCVAGTGMVFVKMYANDFDINRLEVGHMIYTIHTNYFQFVQARLYLEDLNEEDPLKAAVLSMITNLTVDEEVLNEGERREDVDTDLVSVGVDRLGAAVLVNADNQNYWDEEMPFVRDRLRDEGAFLAYPAPRLYIPAAGDPMRPDPFIGGMTLLNTRLAPTQRVVEDDDELFALVLQMTTPIPRPSMTDALGNNYIEEEEGLDVNAEEPEEEEGLDMNAEEAEEDENPWPGLFTQRATTTNAPPWTSAVQNDQRTVSFDMVQTFANAVPGIAVVEEGSPIVNDAPEYERFLGLDDVEPPEAEAEAEAEAEDDTPDIPDDDIDDDHPEDEDDPELEPNGELPGYEAENVDEAITVSSSTVHIELPEEEEAEDDDEEEPEHQTPRVIYDKSKYGPWGGAFAIEYIEDQMQDIFADAIDCNVYINPNYDNYPVRPYIFDEANFQWSRKYRPDNDLPTLAVHLCSSPMGWNYGPGTFAKLPDKIGGFDVRDLNRSHGSNMKLYMYQGQYPAIFADAGMYRDALWEMNGQNRFQIPVAIFTDPNNLFVLGDFHMFWAGSNDEYGEPDDVADDGWYRFIEDIYIRACDMIFVDKSGDLPREWKLKFEPGVDPSPIKNIDSDEFRFLESVYTHRLQHKMCGTVEDAENKRKALVTRLNMAMQQVIDLDREVEEAACNIGWVRERSKGFKDKILIEIDNMRQMPGVNVVTPLADRIVVETEYLSFFDTRHDLFRKLGPMKIEMMLDGTIAFTNLLGTRNGYSKNMHHPHVFNDKHLCAGNIKSTIPHYYKEMAFTGLLDILLQTLASVNAEDSAGHYAGSWPPVEKEMEKFLRQNFNVRNYDAQIMACVVGRKMYEEHLTKLQEEAANAKRIKEILFQKFDAKAILGESFVPVASGGNGGGDTGSRPAPVEGEQHAPATPAYRTFDTPATPYPTVNAYATAVNS
jgi:hypothetical protein